MIDSNVVEKLKERYGNIHPLLFHRSVERAKSNGELFDILESIPEKYPISWCAENRCWATQGDLFISEDFEEKKELE
jgi:hypothetical protein